MSTTSGAGQVPPAPPCPWTAAAGLPLDLPLEEYPGTMLLRLALAIQQDISSTYARSQDLSVAEWRMLARLHADGPMQLVDLCRALALDKPYASRILRTLGPRGLVEVAKDPNHGRRLIIGITDAGRAIARRLLPRMHESQQQLLDVLSIGEREVLYGAIRKLQNAIPECRARAVEAARAAPMPRTSKTPKTTRNPR